MCHFLRLILSNERTAFVFFVFTCSVKGVVGVEDGGEEAEGESTDAERHVKAGVAETLEHLGTWRKNTRNKTNVKE